MIVRRGSQSNNHSSKNDRNTNNNKLGALNHATCPTTNYPDAKYRRGIQNPERPEEGPKISFDHVCFDIFLESATVRRHLVLSDDGSSWVGSARQQQANNLNVSSATSHFKQGHTTTYFASQLQLRSAKFVMLGSLHVMWRSRSERCCTPRRACVFICTT